MKLEICVEDEAGLAAAVAGGADRIELCAALSVGGVSPSAALVRAAAQAGIPARLLARSRPGDFIYGPMEAAQIAREITIAAEAGLDGVVIGASQADRRLDPHMLSAWVAHARSLGAARGAPLGLTLHRAFDLCPDQPAALETAVDLGFDHILSSGGALRAETGLAMLGQLSERAAGRIVVIAGSGINADNVQPFLAAGITEIHASCSSPVGGDGAIEQEFGFAAGPRKAVRTEAVAALRAAMTAFAQGGN